MKVPDILEKMRNRIVKGEYAPGERLPNRAALLKEYKISVGAFQKCINTLIEWGFLESHGMKGVLVSSHPPFNCRYGIVRYASPDEWMFLESFFPSILQSMTKYQQEHPGITFEWFTPQSNSPDDPEYKRLIREQEIGLLAGVIFALEMPPDRVVKAVSKVPTVLMAGSYDGQDFKCPAVAYDWLELFRYQAEKLKPMGVTRSAVLLNWTLSDQTVARIIQCAGECGLNILPRHILGMHGTARYQLLQENMLDLLLSGPDAPDSVIVMNENFLPVLLNRILKLGKIPGTNVKIISHTNAPHTKPHFPEIVYTSFDLNKGLDAVMHSLKDPECQKARTVTLVSPETV